MKLPEIFNPSRSIAGRLTLQVTSTNFFVFVALFGLIVLFICAIGYTIGFFFMGVFTKINNERTDNVLSSVEVAITNTIPEIEENLGNPDKMYIITERILRQNPNIVGSAIAFEPYYFPEKGLYFSPYSYRKDSNILTKQLGTKDYEYHYMDWYLIPKLLAKSYWGDPYYDAGGGEMPLITYSLPLFNNDGNIYAVVTADISLNWMADITSIIGNDFWKKHKKLSKHLYNFIIGRNATYIMHPDEERVLNETIFSTCLDTEDAADDSVAYNMIKGNSDFESFTHNGTSYHIFYAPINRTTWSMGIVVSDKLLALCIGICCIPVIFLMIIGLIIIFFVCKHVIRNVTKPLTHFTNSADKIAQGHFDSELPEINTHDEMQRLRNSFETMQNSLVQQIEETKVINEEKGRIESELQIARNIQMSMVPKIFPPFPDRTDVDVYASLTPAKEVGGDLYDFYIRDEKLFFCIGDVSGKGVPASLFMAVTRALFRTISNHEALPERTVSGINDTMSHNNDSNMFLTLFVGVLDLPTGRLRYTNAGHDAPLLIDKKGERIGFLPVDSNLPAGVVSGWKYTSQEALIDPYTTIFLYTDGLTEAEDAEHKQFGNERLLSIALPDKPRQIIDKMTTAIQDFVGSAEQSDDLTMMAIQYTKQKLDVRMQRSITLTNNIDDVPKLAEFVEIVCEAVGFDMSTSMSLNLAMEEAVVNVMNYAYPTGTIGNVNITAEANDEQLKFVISDNGKPFDPTTKSEVDTTMSVEDRPIGGLGIHLIRQIMDSINYERTGGMNVLTLRKKLV